MPIYHGIVWLHVVQGGICRVSSSSGRFRRPCALGERREEKPLRRHLPPSLPLSCHNGENSALPPV